MGYGAHSVFSGSRSTEHTSRAPPPPPPPQRSVAAEGAGRRRRPRSQRRSRGGEGRDRSAASVARNPLGARPSQAGRRGVDGPCARALLAAGATATATSSRRRPTPGSPTESSRRSPATKGRGRSSLGRAPGLPSWQCRPFATAGSRAASEAQRRQARAARRATRNQPPAKRSRPPVAPGTRGRGRGRGGPADHAEDCWTRRHVALLARSRLQTVRERTRNVRGVRRR